MEKKTSIYRRAAEDGARFGLLLAAVVVCVGATSYYPAMFLPAIVAMIAVPFTMWWFMNRSYVPGSPDGTFSALWMQGIATFFFGSLVMGLITWATIKYLRPGYVVDQLNTAVELLKSANTPQYKELARNITRLIESGEYPTPMDIVLELSYLAVFSGSVLCALLALIIRSRRGTTPLPPNP